MGFAVPGVFSFSHSRVKYILQGNRDDLEIQEGKNSLDMSVKNCCTRSCPLMFLALSAASQR